MNRLGGLFLLLLLLIPSRAGAGTKPAVVSPSGDSLESMPLLPDSSGGGSSKFQASGSTTGNAMEVGRVVLALGGVIGLIVVLRAFAKRMIPGASVSRGPASVKILSRVTVSARQNLLVVQFGKRLLLVGDGGANLNPLCEITDPQEVSDILAQAREETIFVGRRFDSLFGRARKDFDDDADKPAAESFDGSRDLLPPETTVREIVDREITDDDPAIRDTRKELADLQEKVRDVARQIGRA